jgi:hypothetical protein
MKGPFFPRARRSSRIRETLARSSGEALGYVQGGCR